MVRVASPSSPPLRTPRDRCPSSGICRPLVPPVITTAVSPHPTCCPHYSRDRTRQLAGRINTTPATRGATVIPVPVTSTRADCTARMASFPPPIVALFARSSSYSHNSPTFTKNRIPMLACWLSVDRSMGGDEAKTGATPPDGMGWRECTYCPPRTLYRPDPHPCHSRSLVRLFACIYSLSPTNGSLVCVRHRTPDDVPRRSWRTTSTARVVFRLRCLLSFRPGQWLASLGQPFTASRSTTRFLYAVL